jgi:hypothetical protein
MLVIGVLLGEPVLPVTFPLLGAYTDHGAPAARVPAAGQHAVGVPLDGLAAAEEQVALLR